MPSLKELREQRANLFKQFQDIVNRAEAERRDLTREEDLALHENEKQDLGLVTEIRRIELEDKGKDLSRPIPIGSRGESGIFSSGGSGYTASELDKAISAFVRNSHGRGVPGGEWEAASKLGYHPGGAGFDILMNHARPEIGRHQAFFGPQNAGMVTYDPSRGGTLARSLGFAGAFEQALKANGPMLTTSHVWITEVGTDVPWPTIDDTGEYGELVGEANETGEAGIKAGAVIFGSHKLSSKIVRVSQELIDDAPENLSTEVGLALGMRIGRGANRLLTVGDTPNAPSGILLKATVGKETASATAIAAEEIIDLVTSVDPAYQTGPGVGFMMNPAIFGYIAKLKDEEGRFLLGDLTNGATPLLRGWPVYLNPDMPSTLAAGVRTILFGDLSKYKVRMVRQIRLRTLTELYAKSDEIGFLAFLRFDGHLLDAGTHPVKCLQQKAA